MNTLFLTTSLFPTTNNTDEWYAILVWEGGERISVGMSSTIDANNPLSKLNSFPRQGPVNHCITLLEALI